MPGGSFVPLAQEWETAFLIVGFVILASSLALSGLQRLAALTTGGAIVIVTLIVVLLTFHPAASSLAPWAAGWVHLALGR